MSDNVTSIAARQAPVHYSVHITQYFDGQISFSIEGIGNEPTQRSKESVVAVLREIIALIEQSIAPAAAQEGAKS